MVHDKPRCGNWICPSRGDAPHQQTITANKWPGSEGKMISYEEPGGLCGSLTERRGKEAAPWTNFALYVAPMNFLATVRSAADPVLTSEQRNRLQLRIMSHREPVFLRIRSASDRCSLRCYNPGIKVRPCMSAWCLDPLGSKHTSSLGYKDSDHRANFSSVCKEQAYGHAPTSSSSR